MIANTEDQDLLWGFPGITIKAGLVGLPNAGKSLTFNALSQLNVPAENYPFCTIDPNKAILPIGDERLAKLNEIYHPEKQSPANLQLIDLAPLVKGASEGHGLGNSFLSHIQSVDVIFQVVRVFEDQDIVHVQGTIDPIRDMEIIKNELILKDFEFLNKRLSYPQGSTSIEEWNTLLKAKQLLIGKQMIRNGLWKNEEISLLNTYQFLTAKPIIYLINMSTKDFISKENAWLEKIKEWVGLTAQRDVIPYSAAHEVTQDEKGIRMIPQIVKVIRNALGLINFFTAGTYEVRCWTVRRETKMPSAAGLIHIDFKTGFHCAEVMKFTDLAALGNEQTVKASGKYLTKGADDRVEDGDIIFFKFSFPQSA